MLAHHIDKLTLLEGDSFAKIIIISRFISVMVVHITGNGSSGSFNFGIFGILVDSVFFSMFFM